MSMLGLIILIVDLWAILSLLKSNADTMTKVLWTILIVGLPVFGLLIWYLLGPKGTPALAS